MDAKELRIGNYVQWNNFKEARIMNDKDFSLVYESLEKGFDSIDPIPLTEEWLLKFGFEQLIVESYPMYVNNILAIEFYIEECDILFDNVQIASIKYIHQLQNLYFALTGEELTIKK